MSKTTISDTSDQLAVESLALKLIDMPEVQQAVADSRQEFLARPGAQSADGKALLENMVEENMWAGLTSAANMDRAHPKLFWWNNPAREYTNGISVPGCRLGFDNPDRVYRIFPVDPKHRYELHGQCRQESTKSSFLIEACEEAPPGWCHWYSYLQAGDVEYNADGSFVITFDNQPANGRKNHLQLEQLGRVQVRDTMNEWTDDVPMALSVKRVDDLDVKPASFDEVAARASKAVRDQTKYTLFWYDIENDFMVGPGPIADNSIAVRVRPTPMGNQKTWGATGTGKYSIADDEAFVFTIDLQGANYLGIQVTGPWMLSIDFTKHASSLNNYQAYANTDGTITYVIAKRDPGIQNWLDTGGIGDGVFLVRWERMEESDPDTAVTDAKVVKLKDLASVLPKGMPTVSPKEREQYIAERRASYEKRKGFLLT